MIRPMIAADIPHCAEIMVLTPLWQRYSVTLESATKRFTTGLQDGATIFIADTDGIAIGFVWVVKRGAFDLSGYISLLAVSPAHRSGGIGRQLLTAAEDYIRPSARDIVLTCSDFNIDAQRFYERNGYMRVGALPDYVLPGVAELIYIKRLHE
jgi:ribosomal protein S18 acetylase RimI-like enzyme